MNSLQIRCFIFRHVKRFETIFTSTSATNIRL